MRSLAQRAWMLLSALVLVGCGTTVPASSLGSAGGAAGTEPLNAPVAPASSAAGSVPGAGAATPGGAAVSAGDGPAGTGAVAVPGTPTVSGPRDRSPVEIGAIVASTQVVGAFAGLGYEVNPGNPKAMATAMAAWVNAHGGIAGHPVRLVVYERSITMSPSQDDQAACATLTQDHHAVAVVDSTVSSAQLASCLASRGSVLLGGGTGLFVQRDFEQARALWSPYLLAGERLARQLVDRLDAMGWFVPGEKIGVVYNEVHPFPVIKGMVTQRLRALGHVVSAEGSFNTANSQSVAASMNSIALQFKAAGIRRVVVVNTGSQFLLLFTPSARSQDYHPVYTVSTVDVPNTLETLVGPEDLRGAAGIGWSPAVDVNPSRAPAKNSAGKLCERIYAEAEVDTRGPLAGAIAAGYCDGFLFMQRVVDAAGETGQAPFRAAVSRLAGSYVSAVTFDTYFTAGRYDGVEQTRDLRYETACSCFRYASTAMAVR